jgi:hypothetical protein
MTIFGEYIAKSVHTSQNRRKLPLVQNRKAPMDWQLAIDRNREALMRIITALVTLAGLTSPLRGEVSRAQARDGEGQSAFMSRNLHRAILAVLRPAESAVRRLIMIAARGLVLAPRRGRAAPVGLTPSPNQTRIPSFSLIDPLKRYLPSATHADDETDFWNTNDEAPEDDTAFTRTIPRISVPGFVDPVFTTKPQLPDGLVNAQHLARRLIALKNALDNLQSQARRLARWQAKRKHLCQQFPLRPLRLSPLRPGSPPGFRACQTHEVHAILKECQGLVMDLRADTS